MKPDDAEAGAPQRLAAQPNRIAVVAMGSVNPAKVAAATAVFGRLGWSVDLRAVDVPSGVRAQPVGEAETRRGALQRARRALKAAGADLGIGCEAGVAWRGSGGWLINWAVVVTRDGLRCHARGLSLPLPPAAAETVRAGATLGDWVVAAGGDPAGGGLVGLLTGGLVDRRALWEAALAAALSAVLNPELFGTGRRPPSAARAPRHGVAQDANGQPRRKEADDDPAQHV